MVGGREERNKLNTRLFLSKPSWFRQLLVMSRESMERGLFSGSAKGFP